jgi:hypothetical protein
VSSASSPPPGEGREDAIQSTLLPHARKLIGQGWTQHADARDTDGQPIQPWSPHAVAWSLLGALVAALEAGTAENEPLAFARLANACVALAAVIDRDSLDAWNDDATRTPADVLQTLERAEAHAVRTRSTPRLLD